MKLTLFRDSDCPERASFFPPDFSIFLVQTQDLDVTESFSALLDSPVTPSSVPPSLCPAIPSIARSRQWVISSLSALAHFLQCGLGGRATAPTHVLCSSIRLSRWSLSESFALHTWLCFSLSIPRNSSLFTSESSNARYPTGAVNTRGSPWSSRPN